MCKLLDIHEITVCIRIYGDEHAGRLVAYIFDLMQDIGIPVKRISLMKNPRILALLCVALIKPSLVFRNGWELSHHILIIHFLLCLL